MAKQDDGVEELPAPGQAAAPSGGNPWIPVIAVVLAMPILTIGVFQFILIPQMKSAFQEVVGEDLAARGEHAEAGGDGDQEDGDGHGGEGGEAHRYTFSDIVANLAGSLSSRYITVSFIVEGEADNFATLMEENEFRIRDATIGVLTSYDVATMQEPGIKNRIRADLLRAFATALNGNYITNLYFSQFVVQ